MPTQSWGQSISAVRGKAGAWLNAHIELRAKRQRSTREAMHRTAAYGPASSTLSSMGMQDASAMMTANTQLAVVLGTMV